MHSNKIIKIWRFNHIPIYESCLRTFNHDHKSTVCLRTPKLFSSHHNQLKRSTTSSFRTVFAFRHIKFALTVNVVMHYHWYTNIQRFVDQCIHLYLSIPSIYFKNIDMVIPRWYCAVTCVYKKAISCEFINGAGFTAEFGWNAGKQIRGSGFCLVALVSESEWAISF